MKVVYEKHPVSRERKEELRSKGLKIMDVRFKPKESQGVDSKEDQGDKPMTIPQIKKALAAKEIEIPNGVTKHGDLLALLEAADA